MVSGSGDGTLKVWDFLKGKIVSSVICAQDAKLEELDIDDPTNKEQHQFKRTTSWPSILGKFSCINVILFMYIFGEVHSFLKQCFARSSIDTICWYLQLMSDWLEKS